MWRKVELGVKTCECRIGDKAQRVRPGDVLRLVNERTGKMLERRVSLMMLYPTFAAARAWCPLQAGFETWEEFEEEMRIFYGHRLGREPFTVLYLEKA
jgi:ASC-1-like (ASCH) protein